MMKRGDIHYIIDNYTSKGSEQWAGRPAIIVSNDDGNVVSTVVEVVFMTTKPKNNLPTHVSIHATGKASIALCEQVTSVSVERVGDYMGTVSPEELRQLNIALAVSLGIPSPAEVSVPTIINVGSKTDEQTIKKLEEALKKASEDRDLYMRMYDETMKRILGGSNGY